ncbi:S-adenosyl methyltransferase [Nonomuraea solani]|uniref:S-adenosyl methyltransferase n=1 Tax=Nonomuraea solani TaxID=1144553 RepID=A0A1H6EIK9_9ACTN|nr:SAM-dependent methyltransferase [Nonomuraea solani]SEG96739.1 S-adenosyl methyltransferase [Nonomuraea solani]
MDQDRQSGVDTGVPHPARVWNHWLGGKDNYAVDREVGDRILAVAPDLAVIARAEREFLGRVVATVIGANTRQFLDVGTGIPTADNTHEVAQRAVPEASIVYVDNDPIVLAHARALLRGTPEGRIAYLDADLREPETILAGASRTLTFDEPICLLLLGILEFLPDLDRAYEIVRTLTAALPSGSFLAIAGSVRSPSMEQAAALWNEGGGTPITLRDPKELLGFFDGMDVLEPGVVSLPQWRPGLDTRYVDREVSQYGGVARKP